MNMEVKAERKETTTIHHSGIFYADKNCPFSVNLFHVHVLFHKIPVVLEDGFPYCCLTGKVKEQQVGVF